MPEVHGPMSEEAALEHLSQKDVLSDMAWVLRDWEALAEWLTNHGAPTSVDGLIPTGIERVKWVIANVEKTTLIGD